MRPHKAAWVTHLGRDPYSEVTFARGKHRAALHDFSLYAGPRIDPSATHRIERFCRYVARRPIATPRLSLTASCKVLYLLKRLFKGMGGSCAFGGFGHKLSRKPMATRGLPIEAWTAYPQVSMQKGCSTGLLEWKLEER
jgi:Putative transposase